MWSYWEYFRKSGVFFEVFDMCRAKMAFPFVTIRESSSSSSFGASYSIYRNI